MSAIGMASLGVHCSKKQLGMSSLGLYCQYIQTWKEIIKFTLYIRRLFGDNFER